MSRVKWAILRTRMGSLRGYFPYPALSVTCLRTGVALLRLTALLNGKLLQVEFQDGTRAGFGRTNLHGFQLILAVDFFEVLGVEFFDDLI
jgi:hypothetical protein